MGDLERPKMRWVPTPPEPTPPPPPNAWNIMVYLAGDNNLSEEMVYAVKSMFSAGSTENYRVYAFYDAGLDPVPFRIPTRDEREKALTNVKVPPEQPQAHITENHHLFRMAGSARDPKTKPVASTQTTLERFMEAAIEDYPADHCMLVLSGHGSGSVGDFLPAMKRSSGLSIPDLSESLRNVARHFEDQPEKYKGKLDILGLDACQMSTAEVAFEVRDYVQLLVGAEGFEPNTGWPYDQILQNLNAKGCMEPEPLAKSIVEKYIQFYGVDYSLADVSTDLSALRLTQLNEVVKCLNKENGLVECLLKAVEHKDAEKADTEKSDTEESLPVNLLRDAIVLSHWETQGYKSEQNADLWDFCDRLQKRCAGIDSELAREIARECGEVRRMIDSGKHSERDLVVISGYTGPAFQHSHGLSVYFPWAKLRDAAGVSDLEHYQTIRFAAASRWSEFLTEYTRSTRRFSRNRSRRPKHHSTLNRREFLFTGVPVAIRDGQTTVRNGEISLVDGRIFVRDGQISVRDNETLFVLDGQLVTGDGQISVRGGRLSATGEAEFREGKVGDDGKVSVERGESVPIPEGDILSVRDGKISVRGKELRSKDGQISVRGGGTISIRDGQISVRKRKISVRDGLISVRADSLGSDRQVSIRDGEISVREESKILVQNGEVYRGYDAEIREPRDSWTSIRNGNITVTDGQISVRDGQISVRDGHLVVEGGLFDGFIGGDKQKTGRDGQISVRDGQISVRDAEINSIRDGTVMVNGQPIAIRDGQISVRDGQISVRDGQISVRDGVSLLFRSENAGSVSVRDGQISVRDGQISVRDGQISVRGGAISVRGESAGLSGLMSVRDGQISVRDGQISVRDGQISVRDASLLSVRDGQISVRDGQISVRDGQISVRDGQISVRDGGPRIRAGGLVDSAKIASMKNPPVIWHDCDLVLFKSGVPKTATTTALPELYEETKVMIPLDSVGTPEEVPAGAPPSKSPEAKGLKGKATKKRK